MPITKADLNEVEERINEKIKLLPTRDEFLKIMDKVMKELETIRDEQVIAGHQISNHEERIASLENQTTQPPQ